MTRRRKPPVPENKPIEQYTHKDKNRRSVDKRGPKSDEAYTREVLAEMESARNFVVINDEAHHAWRVPAGLKLRGEEKKDAEEATIWIGGLGRLHKARGISRYE